MRALCSHNCAHWHRCGRLRSNRTRLVGWSGSMRSPILPHLSYRYLLHRSIDTNLLLDRDRCVSRLKFRIPSDRSQDPIRLGRGGLQPSSRSFPISSRCSRLHRYVSNKISIVGCRSDLHQPPSLTRPQSNLSNRLEDGRST